MARRDFFAEQFAWRICKFYRCIIILQSSEEIITNQYLPTVPPKIRDFRLQTEFLDFQENAWLRTVGSSWAFLKLVVLAKIGLEEEWTIVPRNNRVHDRREPQNYPVVTGDRPAHIAQLADHGDPRGWLLENSIGRNVLVIHIHHIRKIRK